MGIRKNRRANTKERTDITTAKIIKTLTNDCSSEGFIPCGV